MNNLEIYQEVNLLVIKMYTNGMGDYKSSFYKIKEFLLKANIEISKKKDYLNLIEVTEDVIIEFDNGKLENHTLIAECIKRLELDFLLYQSK